MRLSRLRLNGFKSFVDPTELIIADGLTGVVGPNGCGKSNLLEALRWVMGENRPTAMRGDGMEDVIFAGSASRPARHFAEVTVSIDNSERRAPAGFNDADLLEITRRITRDAGSAYKMAGRDVRARDVQMVFADASTGAHSPALVRQGQIAELINARPQARRRILEEAAGIAGLYQRRHEAELKLRGAETNLARVDDVLEQLAQQLSQLARQARQAARYREIGAALRRTEGMLLFRRWHEADTARLAAGAELSERTRAVAEAETRARRAEAARGTAAEALPSLREEETIAAAVLQRLDVERSQLADEQTRAGAAISALESRIAQLSQDTEREATLNRDADAMIGRLEAERDRLARADDGQEARLAEAAEAAQTAARELREREAALDAATEDAGRLSARHQSAARMREDARSTLARAQAEAERARVAGAEARGALEAAASAHAAAETEAAGAADAAEAAETALAEADAARAETQAREAEARAERSAAEGEASALRAEVAALARLVTRETAEAGQILDRTEVTPGHEAALGAALGDDLHAAESAETGTSGWALLPAYAAEQPLPDGAAPLAAHVRAPPVLARRLAQVGLVARDDGGRLQADLAPGQRLVSPEGDLWRWDGYRMAAEDAPSAAALRLQQINRLVQLKRNLEEAAARADGAARAHAVLSDRLAEADTADREAREARRAADQVLAEARLRLSRSEADHGLAEGRLEAQRLAEARFADEARAAAGRLSEAEAALAALDDLDAARARVEAQRGEVETARAAMLSLRAAHDELRRAGEARARRRGEVAKELAGWQQRRQNAGSRIAELQQRKAAAEAELDGARRRPAEIAGALTRLSDRLAEAETLRRKAADALAEAEGALGTAEREAREAERAASEAREARARAEATADAAAETVRAASARIAEALDTTPEDLLADLDTDLERIPSAETLEPEAARLRRARDALGAVNLRAEEDAREVETEYDNLAREKVDLEAAIARLRSGIASLNREGRERLLAAFEQVNVNFAMLFQRLFGGGEARLVLVESDDPLEAGLEIMCQPPGKKLSTLSLLSGGEQTLTALALIFAVFLANPAPICVLDEVDAPLDDANVTRFCDLLDEMTRQTGTRFLVITHHAITMARMDRLFGVTMAEQGVSQLVSVDLARAERLVA